VSPRPTAAALALCTGALLAVPALAGTTAASAAPPAAAGRTCPAPAALTFAEPKYVDTTRAGGEPLVATLPDGRLIYSAHAGTTHFFTPEAPAPGTAAFVQNYTNQTYVWTSDDDGATWEFRPRFLPPDNAPATGFSDPEVAIDAAGNVYFSEINLANVAVSKSTDNSETYTLQNFFGAILTDRQWMEADREDELYFVANAFGGGTGVPPSPGLGHYITKSTDGGATFSTNVPDTEGGAGIGDIRVDKRTGTVYETHHPSYGTSSGTLSMASFRNARSGDLTPETTVIAEDVNAVSHWPTFDLDPEGNLYVVWDESGRGEREAGVWFASSTDGARTWSAPVRVDRTDDTDIWPWLAVGDKGRVAISWLEADVALPENDAETTGDHGWRIVGAATTTGLGCAGGGTPSFSVATATKEPVHTGTICQGGTTCQAALIDRRLGDYFSMEVDGTGRMYMGYSDTRIPGAVSLPGFVRQSGGPSLLAPKSAPGRTPTATTGQPAQAVEPPAVAGGALPATGATALLPWSGALVLLGLGLALRRRRTA
jgi:LPXTG-motif cell wall-anchored protein